MRLFLAAFVAGYAVVGAFFVWAVTNVARGQDCVEGAFGCHHEESHDHYKDWHRENEDGTPGMSCCHDGDCRPTRAYQDEDGRWHAWTGLHFTLVPLEAMKKADLLKDGRNHVCAAQWNEDHIYCFSPAQPKG